MKILGLDPSLSSTGWGVIEENAGRLHYVADGFIKTDAKLPIYERLLVLHNGLKQVLAQYQPDEAAIEQVYLNDNPSSTMKLCMARGVVILAPALNGLRVREYEPTLVKKAIVGVGRAEKSQVEAMVKVLLPGAKPKNNDSSDALAIAIAHANLRNAYDRKS